MADKVRWIAATCSPRKTEVIEVVSDDSAFAEDLEAWRHYAGHRLPSLNKELRAIRAVVVKGSPAPASAP